MKHSNVLLLCIVETITFCFALYSLSYQLYPVPECIFLLLFSVGAITCLFFMGETSS